MHCYGVHIKGSVGSGAIPSPPSLQIQMASISADIIIIIVFASILLAFMAFMLIKTFWQRSSIGRRFNFGNVKNDRDSPFERA